MFQSVFFSKYFSKSAFREKLFFCFAKIVSAFIQKYFFPPKRQIWKKSIIGQKEAIILVAKPLPPVKLNCLFRVGSTDMRLLAVPKGS